MVLDSLGHLGVREFLGHPCLLSGSLSQVVSSVPLPALEGREVLANLSHPCLLWVLGSSIPCFLWVLEDREDLEGPHSLWVLQGQLDLDTRGVLERQEFLAIQVIPLLLFLPNCLWQSHHLGLPFVLADQVDPAVLVIQGFLNFLGNLGHPLSHCNLVFLLGLEVHPALADLEVLVFLEILANLEVLLFLLDHLVLKVHHFPFLLWVRSAPLVRGTLGRLAVR